MARFSAWRRGIKTHPRHCLNSPFAPPSPLAILLSFCSKQVPPAPWLLALDSPPPPCLSSPSGLESAQNSPASVCSALGDNGVRPLFQLRYLQTLNAISAENNSTIIFPLPIDVLTHMIHRNKEDD